MTELRLLEVALIKPDPNQPRKEFDKEDLEALAEGIKAQGLIHPIEIDEHNTIIDGERRWRAIKLLGWKTITCIINLKVNEMNKRDTNYKLKRQLQANLTGRNLKIKEAKEQIEKLRNVTQLSNRKLATELGISASSLDQYSRIAQSGSPALIKAVESKELEDTLVASQIAALPTKTQEAIIAKITEDELSRKQAQELISDVKSLPEEKAEEWIDKVDAINESADKIRTALKEAMIANNKEMPYDHEKGNKTANIDFQRLIYKQIHSKIIYCPRHNGGKLIWDCCKKEVGE